VSISNGCRKTRKGLLWDSDEVNVRLQKIMARAFHDMLERDAQDTNVPPRARSD